MLKEEGIEPKTSYVRANAINYLSYKPFQRKSLSNWLELTAKATPSLATIPPIICFAKLKVGFKLKLYSKVVTLACIKSPLPKWTIGQDINILYWNGQDINYFYN